MSVKISKAKADKIRQLALKHQKKYGLPAKTKKK